MEKVEELEILDWGKYRWFVELNLFWLVVLRENLCSLLSIGVDFKIKQLTIGGKRLKLTIWDTGNELNQMDLCFTFSMISILELDTEFLDHFENLSIG